MRSITFTVIACALGIFTFSKTGYAQEHYFKGPKVCKECHEAEFNVWRKTAHYKAYKGFHKLPKAKKLAKSIGSSKRTKKNDVCAKCHYTMVGAKKPKAKSGTSCESCHGAASGWVKIHNDYGSHKKEAEPAEHKAKRLAHAKEKGMLHSRMHYQIAENCMSCHGLARADISPKDLAALLAANHPVQPDYELVQYSQGSVRHRFYPPDMSVNQEMTPAELARLYVVGQAAKLVSASTALGRSDDTKYKELQQHRIESAKRALAALKSVPEAAALAANPTREGGLKLATAIRDKDLSEEVGSMLPNPNKYK